MEELELPSRLFETGFEPSGKKRVNNYFKLRWIELIKFALEDEDLEKLQASQFGTVLRMGGHTFSVMFAHYFLSRQLISEKECELWWTFAGKPIRYAIEEFALVTGLNCEEPTTPMHAKEKVVGRGKGLAKGKGTTSSSSIWEALFGGEDKPTASWIMDRLILGKKYKDPLTRLRLSLLVLVEGVLCPTCGSTKIRPEVVSMLGNLDEFLKYPWGRESFLLTVNSAKARSPLPYVQDTIAIQGFVHAMVLVTLTACPSILVKVEDEESIANACRSSDEILGDLVTRKLSVNVPWAKTVDQKGQAHVRSCVGAGARAEILRRGLADEEDDKVANMLSLIEDDYPFEHNTWIGGVKADDVKQKKVTTSTQHPEASECNQIGDPVREDDFHRGSASGVDNRERLSRQPSPERVHDVDSVSLLRLERYMQGIKDHFDVVTDGIRAELGTAVKAIRELDSIIKSAVAKGVSFTDVQGNMDNMEYPRSPIGGSPPTGFNSTNPPADVDGQFHGTEETDHPVPAEYGPVQDESSQIQKDASETLAENETVLVVDPKPVTSPGVVPDVHKQAERTQDVSSQINITATVLDSSRYEVGSGDIVEDVSQVNATGRRCSKRRRQNPVRYSPAELKKKETNKRKADIANAAKVGPAEKVKKVMPSGVDVRHVEQVNKVTPSTGPTPLPGDEDILLVGGFHPFVPTISSKRSAFLKAMEDAKTREHESGADVPFLKLLDVFQCSGVCDPKGIDQVVQFMMNRRDQSPSSRFDFVPSGFFTNLIRNFPSFDGYEDKQHFTFSTNLRGQFIERPQGFVDVDVVYSPVLISPKQWVGMIVDFQDWSIHIVDFNRACPTDFRVNDVITHISILLPHLIHRYTQTNRALELDFVPMPISRLDIPVLLEHPGFAAVGALLLLEFHAVGRPFSSGALTAENVRIAAENYAIATLEMTHSVSVAHAE